MHLFCLRFIKIRYEVILPIYVLRTYFYVYSYACVLLRDRLSTFNTQQAVWLCFPGMTSSLVKSKQIIGAYFQTIFSTIFLFFDVPQYSYRLDYIKDIVHQLTLATKKSLHIIFKASTMSDRVSSITQNARQIRD